MGFDPTASSMSEPFVRADNHFELAYQAGLGTHHLDEIEVVGEAIANIRHPFKVSN